jgi:hypothetical protein
MREAHQKRLFYPEPEQRGRKRQPSKTKQETISELKESLPEVQKAKPKAKAKNEPKARSRTRSHHEVVLPTKDDGVVHIEDIVGDRHTSTSASEKPKKTRRRKHKTLEDVDKAIRARENPHGIGQKHAVAVGAGKPSKSKNVLPHFDIDPRYAIVL